jgi:hypothetical protein
VELRILGALEAVDDGGRAVRLRGPRQLALAAWLIRRSCPMRTRTALALWRGAARAGRRDARGPARRARSRARGASSSARERSAPDQPLEAVRGGSRRAASRRRPRRSPARCPRARRAGCPSHSSRARCSEGDVADSVTLANEVVELARTLGDPVPTGAALDRAGFARWTAGDAEGARAQLREAVAIRRDAGLPELFDDFSHAVLGVIALEAGRTEEALAEFRQMLAHAAARGISHPTGFPLLGAAVALQRAGDVDRAARLYAFVDANHHRAEVELLRQVAAYRVELEATPPAAAAREGRSLALEDAIALALADG